MLSSIIKNMSVIKFNKIHWSLILVRWHQFWSHPRFNHCFSFIPKARESSFQQSLCVSFPSTPFPDLHLPGPLCWLPRGFPPFIPCSLWLHPTCTRASSSVQDDALIYISSPNLPANLYTQCSALLNISTELRGIFTRKHPKWNYSNHGPYTPNWLFLQSIHLK